MKNDDVQLVQRALDGDDTAFSALVRKYQRSVHALAWRKIGDFHIAEDITQDTFLKAHQRLSTLKEPQRFASWLYVITANQCKAWFRKNRAWTQAAEDTGRAALKKETYSGYVIAENDQMVVETKSEVVKKLLAKLQESDRTVITLYYLGGMTYKEISEFLGVSEATVRNRLYRARRRLKKEEPMIREALGNFQITPNLTENILREIARLKPVAPTSSKPVVPWAIAASTIVVIFLILGISSQYLSRFQKPYSFEAASEMTVEILEAPVVLEREAKPDIRSQIGVRANVPNKSDGTNPQANQVLANQEGYTRWGLPEDAKARIGKGVFTDMQLSPDGTRLAIASSAGVWLYDTSTNTETALITDNTDLTGLVALSPDGRILATAGGDKKCRIWDIESRELRLTFKAPDWLHSLTFLDDGKTLVGEGLIDKISKPLLGGDPSMWDVPKVWMWDVRTGKLLDSFTTELPKFNPLKDARTSVWVKAFANSTRVIFAFENRDGTISVKDGRMHREIVTLPRPEAEVKGFSFTPDGGMLAVATARNVHLWDLDIGEQVLTFPKRIVIPYGNPSIFAFSKDGKVLAVAGLDDIEIWDMDTQSRVATLENRVAGPQEFVLSADGTTLITINHNGAVEVWSATTGEHERTLTTGYASKFATLVFSPDGETIASSTGSKVYLWDANTGAEKLWMQFPEKGLQGAEKGLRGAVAMKYTNEIISLAFSEYSTPVAASPYGSTLVAFTVSGKIGIWDVATGEYSTDYDLVDLPHTAPRSAVPRSALVPTPRTPAIYHAGAALFNRSGQLLRAAVFSPDGEKLAVENRNEVMEIWDVLTRRRLWTLPGHLPNKNSLLAFALTFTPDGEVLAIGDGSNVHLADAETGEIYDTFDLSAQQLSLIDKLQRLFDPQGWDSRVGAVALARAGEPLILAASGGTSIYVWDVATREPIVLLKEHTAEVCQLAFSPEATLLATGDTEGTIHVWSLPTGRKLATFKPYAGPVSQLAFSPDGKTLASTNEHSHFAGTILLWDVPSP